jgi:hypothetical protein
MAGFGLVAVVFMAIMSAFYLKQLPGKAQMKRLKSDLNIEHGLYLEADSAIEAKLIPAKRDGGELGLRVSCSLRPEVCQRGKPTVDAVLARIGRSAIVHPSLKRTVDYVTVVHDGKPATERTIRSGEQDESAPARPRQPKRTRSAAAKG